jgi:short-subunit dehydrogenase
MKNIIIVTGASSGIGMEFVKQLDHFGADEIWGIGLGWDGAGEVSLATPLVKMELDLTNVDQVESFQERIEAENPHIMWLVNCAGFARFGSYQEIPLDVSVNMIELNVVALVKLSEICIPYMREGSKIVQVASMAGFLSTPNMNVYGASKAFVLSYSRSLRAELKPKKIGVTCLCPLWTQTPLIDKAKAQTSRAVPKMGKLLTTERVVRACIQKAQKGKEVCIVGAKSWWIKLGAKLLPHRTVMNAWLSSQKHK